VRYPGMVILQKISPRLEYLDCCDWTHEKQIRWHVARCRNGANSFCTWQHVHAFDIKIVRKLAIVNADSVSALVKLCKA
jgi:hypothetical protein